MKSRKVLIVIATLTFFLTLANSVLMALDTFFYSIDDIPRGEVIFAQTSREGTSEERTVTMYKVSNSLGTAILCTAKTPDTEERNIYWQVGVEDVNIQWTDVNRVLFTAEGKDDVALNIDKDSFDCRVVVEESESVVDKVKS